MSLCTVNSDQNTTLTEAVDLIVYKNSSSSSGRWDRQTSAFYIRSSSYRKSGVGTQHGGNVASLGEIYKVCGSEIGAV